MDKDTIFFVLWAFATIALWIVGGYLYFTSDARNNYYSLLELVAGAFGIAFFSIAAYPLLLIWLLSRIKFKRKKTLK